MDKQLWVLCPICNNKTRTKVREDTELINFPLFCPKCKTETLINSEPRELYATTFSKESERPTQ